MNSFTLRFSDSSLENQCQQELTRQKQIKFTRFILLENVFLIIMQVHSSFFSVKPSVFAPFVLGIIMTIIILILKKKESRFLLHCLLINYWGLIVFFTEMLRLQIYENQVTAGVMVQTVGFIIPFQVLHSLMIYVKYKWAFSSVVYFGSLVYLFFRVMLGRPHNSYSLSFVILSLALSWFIHTIMGYDQEKTFKIFYKDVIESYEKINNYKLILKNVIPTPIFIIDPEKHQIKFTNNSGYNIIHNRNELFEENAHFDDLARFLKKFSVLQENVETIASSRKAIDEDLNTIFRNYYNDMKQRPFPANYERDVDQYFMKINVWCAGSGEKSSDEGILDKGKENDDGKSYYEIKIIKVFWEDSVCLLLMFNDSTSGFRIAELLNLNLYKNQLLASVSHDLRTPLNGLHGMLDLSLSKTNDESIKSYLSLAKKSAYFLNYLINDILDFSLMNFKKMRLNIEEVRLQPIIDHLMGLIEFQAREKNIECKVLIKCKQILPFFSDATRIKQILLNLLSNALKFTFKGTIDLIVEDSTEHPGEPFYKISVKDSGIGIKKEDLGKLYHLFGRLEDEAKMNKTGIGLGLTISKKISILLCPEKLEGLQVESTYGKGSTFFFYLSSLRKNEGSAESMEILETNMDEKCTFKLPSQSHQKKFLEKESWTTIESSIQFKKILVVDDDLMNLMIVEEYLQMFSLKCLKSMNGLDGYKAIKKDFKDKKHEICLVIMDCNMPILDGFQASLKIRKFFEKRGGKKIPIIALTANMTASDILLSQSSGMDYLLEKPLKKQELKNILEKILHI